MVVFPNCKINIGLNIIEKRKDGFHNIETVFYPIRSLFDVLEVQQSKKFSFENAALLSIKQEDNLCVKAFKLLLAAYPTIQNTQFYLLKNIPLGAGLGGGSSDASFTLKALNELYDLNISEENLVRMAEKIGSDCPFFIKNKPCFAEKKGEIIAPIQLDLEKYAIVIIYPAIEISTQWAYENIVPQPPLVPLKTLIQMPLSEWKDTIVNDFETIIFKQYPLLKDLKAFLYTEGALYAALSGTGSAVYGIFKAQKDLIFPAQFPANLYTHWQEPIQKI